MICLDNLPELRPFPTVATRLLTACDNPEVDPSEISEIVQCDPSYVVKLLKVANSSMFSTMNAVVTVDEAIVILGFRTIRNLILGISAGEVFGGNTPEAKRLWKHTLGCATVARVVAPHVDVKPDEAFLAGILHDVGKIVFFDMAEKEYIQATANANALNILDIEQETFGTTHHELGLRCAEEWGLPFDFNEAISCHHTPEEAVEAFDLVGVTSIANCMAHHWGLCGQVQEQEVDQILERTELDLKRDLLDGLQEQVLEELTSVQSMCS